MNIIRTFYVRFLIIRQVLIATCVAMLLSFQSFSQCPPATSFIASTNLACSGIPVQFSNTSSGSNLSFLWNFGDGTTSVLQDPIHTFPDLSGVGSDSYTVTLTATNTILNCSSSTTASIIVKKKPSVYYWQANNFKVCLNSLNSLPYNISVYNYSDTINISSYTVDWGDGSVVQNVPLPFNTSTPFSHVYNNSGYYPIHFTAVGTNGCINSTTDTLSIISNPVAQFTPPPSGTNTGCTPLTINIINTSSNVTPNTLTIVSWGDLSYDTLALGQVAGDTIYHTYYNPTCDISGLSNPYLIQLTTINTCGSSYLVYYPINVYKKPIAIFALGEDTVCINNPANFANISIPNFCASNPVTFYQWNFGDGSGTGLIPGLPINPTPDVSHVYTAPGVYNVNLEASNTSMNGCGLTDTTLKIVVVQTVAEFNHDNVCLNSPTHFYDSSWTIGGYVYAWLWEFGDGTTSSVKNPTHTYLNPGTYNVILHSTGNTGCTDTVSHQVIVYPKPLPNFSFTHTCTGDTVHFTDLSTSTSSIVWTLWNFGDGTFSTLQNPTHYYSTPGTYQVTLSLTNALGCSKSITQTLSVRLLPNAQFATSSSISCVLNPQIPFTDSSTSPNGSIQSWTWQFGDGTSSNLQNPGHSYLNFGSFWVTLIVTDQMGCVDSITHLQTVNPLPSANFVADTVCFGTPTHFTDQSSQQVGTIINKWKWHFGDNQIDSLNQNPSHIYANPGLYNVMLVIFNLNGCSDTANQNVWVDSIPSPAFTANTVCIGNTTTFTQNSVAHGSPIVEWDWLFGDGGSAITPNPSHLYSSSGTFNVVLKVTDNKGCSNQITQSLNVYPYPNPDFFIVPSCLGQPTQFLDSSSGLGFPIVSWSWNFGDGTFSSLQNPIKTYNSVATYNIQLTISNANNCLSSISKSFVFDSLPEIHFYTDTVCLGSPTHFYDISVSHGSNNFSWLWNFGDGTSSLLQFPSHTFSTHGLHNVSLIVTNIRGCSDTLIMPVIVDTLPSPQYTANTVCLGNSTQFNQHSIGHGGANITNWNWSFGDGNISNAVNPTHIYSGLITYNASLQVTDSKGCSSTITHPVNVYPLPVANFSTINNCLGYLTTFSDSSNYAGGTLSSQKWFFGDGGSANNILHPIHVYPSEGIYNVVYIISNTNGCIDTIIKPVKIDSLPFVFFISDTACKGSATHFFDYSQWHGSLNVSWRWYFGDGFSSNVQHPSHTYLNSGNYNATLIVTNQFGCSDTVILPVHVDSIPTANFSSVNVPLGSPTPFTNLSVPHGSPIVSWQWYFGDGTSSTLSNPNHFYATASTFTVKLIVRDAKGCLDTVIHTTTVYPLPLPNFIANAVCFGDTTHFTDISLPSGSPIIGWSWNFGDGSTSIIHNPNHLYTNPGTYIVKLKVTALNGSSDSITKNVIVYNLPIPNFTSSISCFNTPTQFTNISSWLIAPISYSSWSFGDGTTSSNSNPLHQYALASSLTNFTVILTVTDTNGCSKSISHIQVIYPEVFAQFLSDTVCSLSPIQVIDQSNSPSGIITNWQWSFGNGSISNLQTPIYTYPIVNNPTYYPVRLVATDNHSCKDTIQHFLLVNPLPQVNFTNDTVCFGSTTHFFNNSFSTGGAITNWLWSFDGAGSSSIQQPVYVFNHWGISNTSLTVTDNNGCSKTLSKQVMVDSLPIVNFIWSGNCATSLVDFFDQSTGNGNLISSWYWDFGDLNYSSLQNPSHYYNIVDTFNITLTVTNTRGCLNSASQALYVNPSLGFTFNSDTVCSGESTTFTHSILNPNTHLVAWHWDFGDGSSSVSINPMHQYALSGNYNVSLTVLDSNGCVESITNLVKVNPLPVADFSANNVCLGTPSLFIDISSGMGSAIVSREWDLGDGTNILGGLTQTHVYTNSGSYTCRLIIINANGCSDTIIKIVNVISVPLADFSFNNACLGSNTLFTDNSICLNGVINSHLWNFGDGSSYYIPTPAQYTQYLNHLYNLPGSYQVSLVVANSFCSDTALINIVIDSIPEAHFINTSACFGDSTIFTDQSITTDNIIVSWSWTFGDGHTSSQINPLHQYASPGTYLASLTVIDSKGCIDSIQHWVLVRTLPVANFSFIPANAGIPVVFNDLSIANGGAINNWQWNFGNGDTSLLQNPIEVYVNPGFYTISLHITNIWGCSDTASHVVLINSPVIQAAFSFVTGCIGSTTLFTDSSTLSWGFISQWLWDFGDGFSSTLQNPSHTYAAPGNYNVTLIIHGNYNNSDTIIHIVPVHTIPLANFDYSSPCVNASTDFTNTSTVAPGNIVGSTWLFDNGLIDNTFNSSKVYTDTGSYLVSLIVISDMGCSDTVTRTLSVSPQPEVHFSSNLTNGCAPLIVNFMDSSIVMNGSITDWIWNFGDGNTSNSPIQVSHTYLSTGNYSVVLKIISDQGCSNMLTINNFITVHQNPIASFTHAPDWVTEIDGTVWFSDLSFGASTWEWDFGNGMNSYLQSPVTTYNTEGNPTITLIVSNNYGCKDTTMHVLYVYHDDAFFIPNAFTPTADNLNSYFGPYGVDLESKHFRMYVWDRWGGLVFSSTNYSQLWDGKDKKGDPCPLGVYVYKLFLDDKNGESKEKNGQVTLVR